ncbi:MAG: thiamine phosphate synthase [Chloroflexia bacterium]|nr:thiamine phosphate synthase [Chloroflexia bacterium]
MKIDDVDFSLYVITDADVSGGRLHTEVVRLALEGGATVIQYRDKRASLRRMLDVGEELRRLCARHGATFIVNDRPDLAIALQADGVHLGPEDMPPATVRGIVGSEMLIGVSTDDAREAREAEADGADYLIARPVFPTSWQMEGRPTMGVAGLQRIVQAVSLPVLADGGVNRKTIEDVLGVGVAGPAITTAIVGAADPDEAARELRGMVDAYRQQVATG